MPDSDPSSVTSALSPLSSVAIQVTYTRCLSVELTELLWGLSELVSVKLLKHCLAHSKCYVIAGYCNMTAEDVPSSPSHLTVLGQLRVSSSPDLERVSVYVILDQEVDTSWRPSASLTDFKLCLISYLDLSTHTFCSSRPRSHSYSTSSFHILLEGYRLCLIPENALEKVYQITRIHK